MVEETITFELIRGIQREEQRTPKLSIIQDNFYKTVVEYIQTKRKLIQKDRKGSIEVKSIERLVQDIFDRRERKIITFAVNAARTNIQPENMLDEEKDFFDLITVTIKQRRDENFKKFFKEEKIFKTDLIVFKDNVPKFVGSDMKNYGPYKKGDIAKIPNDNVKILLNQGVIEQFEISK